MTVNARYLLVFRKTLGADAVVDKILNEPESAEGKLFVKAKALFTNKLKKQYVEASLLASKDLAQISELLDLPLDLITMYRDFFYDVTDLDKLSKLDLLNVSDRGEGLLKLWAVSQGLPFIEWRLGGKVTVSPIEGLQDLFTTCIYKSKEAMFNPNTSDASKESTKYIKLAMDLARLLKVWVLDSAAAKKDIELALMEVVPDFKGLESLETDTENSIDSENSDSDNIDTVLNVDVDTAVPSFGLDDLL